MNALPRCSVIIPTRNCLGLLPQAIASVRMQNIANIEILVVDDGSTDGSWDWLEAERQKDPVLTALRGPARGPAAARNIALEKAKAPIVAFLDADDFWFPNKLAAQLAFHEAHPEVSFSFTDYLHYDPRGALYGSCFDYWRPDFISRDGFDFALLPEAEWALLGVNVVGASTVLASTRALQNANGFAEASLSAEDWLLWLKLAAAGPVAVSAAVTTGYLMRPGSETQNKSARIAAMRDIAAPYRDRPEPAARRGYRRAQARIALAEAEQAQALGAHFRAARAFWRSFALWPRRRVARAALGDLRAALRPPRR